MVAGVRDGDSSQRSHCSGEPDVRRIAGYCYRWQRYHSDDGFFYSTGYHARISLLVDTVIGYRFGAGERELSGFYRGSGTRVLAGPRFAPVDAEVLLRRARRGSQCVAHAGHMRFDESRQDA